MNVYLARFCQRHSLDCDDMRARLREPNGEINLLQEIVDDEPEASKHLREIHEDIASYWHDLQMADFGSAA